MKETKKGRKEAWEVGGKNRNKEEKERKKR